jgi:hypothetical protein
MRVLVKEFKNSFIPLRDNYFLELKTQKVYAMCGFDNNEVVLIEPKMYEKNFEKIAQKLPKVIEKIVKETI